MDQWRSGDGAEAPDGSATVVVRRHRGRRLATIAALSLLLVLVALLAIVWVARRPIATGVLEREFERRGVEASYKLERVGLRTQQVSNLVIGDPARPDLTARFAQIQMRIKWNGSFEVYRIVARGVRLHGRVVRGRVSWGQVDKLLPPPSDKPFALPNFVLDVADSTIRLDTPFGRLGFAVEGTGKLTGGFKGKLAVRSAALNPGRCKVTDLRANVAVEVVARRPHVQGPVRIDRFACPQSRFEINSPEFNVDTRFNEAFTKFEGKGRMAIATMVAGENGLANFVGNLTFNGSPEAVSGDVKLAAQKSRLAAIFAERTRLVGKYRLGITAGTMVMVGDYAAEDATLAGSMVSGITQPLLAASGTPIGPIATAAANAIGRSLRDFDATGGLRMVNFPGGGAARIETAAVRSASGASVRVSGGDGVTYYWPSGRIRVDGQIQMAGGGLPQGRILLRQPRSGAPMSGVAEFAPYAAGDSRLALAPIRFAAGRDGSTQVSTVAVLDGPIPDGRIRGLRIPISGRLGARGGFSIGTSCIDVSVAEVRSGGLRLGSTSLPVCPVGGAIFSQRPGGPLQIGAQVSRPVLAGTLGGAPLLARAANGRIVGTRFTFDDLALRLGRPETPIIFNADRLQGSYEGKALTGSFAGANSTIRNVPLALSAMSGDWRVRSGDLFVNGAATVSDRNPNPRFYPMRTNDLSFSLADGDIRAGGTLRHPASGTRVTDVSIRHDIASGRGQALLDVPGITFGPQFQPEELTRLTEGVIALVRGTVAGQGRINWTGDKVSSTGEFSTAGMDLAAPFGPVTGLTTTARFTDLLNLETAPGQVATLRSINPGILVENGVIRYQLLRNQMVKVERGEWPFMGGRLVLQETVLNFGRPSAKRLTFQVIGLNAQTFVETLGFTGIEATGIFDGVLPMIFDESGGRVVGGRLESRPGGGTLAYTGPVGKLGFVQRIAFDALRSLRYRHMVIRLDGDLAGEFATRLTIDSLGLNTTGKAKILSAFNRIPMRFNIAIRGPFRALIATARSFRDPRELIRDVLPVPLDEVPGIVTEVRTRRETETQTQTPVVESIEVTPTPPAPSER